MTTTADQMASAALEQQMRTVLDAHWSADGAMLDDPAFRRRRWFAALDERNWRVPGWPRHAGGEGWPEDAQARWRARPCPTPWAAMWSGRCC